MVAKANCYGLGAKNICQNLDKFADYFAVSSAKEFYEIKRFVTKPVVILDPVVSGEKQLAKNDAELTIADCKSLENILKIASEVKFKIRVHLAINTGMNRFGFKDKKELYDAILKIKKTQNIIISGVFSHYFDANNEKFVDLQYNRFMAIKKFCLAEFNLNSNFHLAASDGIISKNGFDMVRAGMMIYSDKFEDTITLKSRVLSIQKLARNETAGYGAVFKADKQTSLAIVGIGYGDGLLRNIVKNGYVLVNNKYAKIVAICMDTMLVDVTNFDVKIYDEVVLIGRQKDKQIFICDVASWCDTIDYEIIVRLSARIARKYIK